MNESIHQSMNQEMTVPSSKPKSNISLWYTRHMHFSEHIELYNKRMNPDVTYGVLLKKNISLLVHHL